MHTAMHKHYYCRLKTDRNFLENSVVFLFGGKKTSVFQLEAFINVLTIKKTASAL